MRVPVYERRESVAPLPGAYVRAAGGAEAYGAGVAQAVSGLGERLGTMARDWEDARTLELFNQFRRETAQWHDDPEKGVLNTRRGGLASGVTREADEYMRRRGKELARKTPGGRARQNFLRLTERLIQDQEARNSRFEAQELRKFQDEQGAAAVALVQDEALKRGAWDSAAAERDLEEMGQAWELMTRNRGMSPEAREAAWAEIQDRYYTAWADRFIKEDPEAAREWFEENRGKFSGAAAVKVGDAVKKAARIYELQAFADEWTARYPEEKIDAGIAAIRSQYSGQEEEDRVRAYRGRLEEQVLGEERRRRTESRIQADRYDAYIGQGTAGGGWPSQEQLQEDYNSGLLSGAQVRSLQGMRAQAANQAAVRKRLEKDVPGWNLLKEKEQDEAVMRAMGVSGEERTAAADYVFRMVFDPEVSDREVRGAANAAFANGMLTRRERDSLLDMRGTLQKDQREFVSLKQSELDTLIAWTLAETGMKAADARDVRAVMQNAFKQAVGGLDYRSGTYRKDVTEAVRTAFLAGVDRSKEYWKANRGNMLPQNINDALSSLEQEAREAAEPERKLILDDVNLTPRERAAERTSYEALRDTVDRAALDFGVEPALIRAIIQAESNWRTDAVSSAGAQGLMQLMPETAAGLGVKDAFDAEQNIRGGTKYIAGLIKRYGGDIETALAAYNWGPGNVDSGRTPPAVTRSYIEKVMRDYNRLQGAVKAPPMEIDIPKKQGR